MFIAPNTNRIIQSPRVDMMAALALVLAVGVVGISQAHAELTIWHVENNPSGTDSGNEWLTLINTGSNDTFDGYGIQTTNGRIASYDLPTKTLGMCEYYKITLQKQTIDNENDTVKLLKNGTTIYETPVIEDTKNDDRFWTNPDVAAICGDALMGAAPDPVYEPATDLTLEERITALETEVSLLHQIIQNILEILNNLLGAN